MSEAVDTQRTAADYFEENKYVLLEGVLTPELCKDLTKRMFDLHESGGMVMDDQCPKSHSIYGDPVFDSFLEKLAEPIGEHIGKKLIPTYTYARIYRPGEVLERHTDRPACEISGTMTLGHDGINVWPIYVTDQPDDEDGKRIDVKVGDILMYRGEDLAHWRPAFKGKWQCQVFFHYVDANGPHAEKEAWDGRPRLGLPAESKFQDVAEVENTQVEEIKAIPTKQRGLAELPEKQTRTGVFPIFDGVMIPSWDLELPGVMSVNSESNIKLALTPEECEKVISFASDAYADPGSIGTGKEGAINRNVRNVNLYRIPLDEATKWIFDRIARVVSIANNEYYDFEIMGITHELQLLHYESGKTPGHYNWHMDVGGGTSSTRKISMSIQLSDPSTYEGGQLTVNSNGQDVVVPDEQGAINMFPSYCLHKVDPMKSGERWALVIWVHGSKRFR